MEPDNLTPAQNKELLLFTTPTCANCSMTKKALAEAGIAFSVLESSEHQDLIEKYGVLQAPTLVVVTDNGEEKFSGLINIKEYIRNYCTISVPSDKQCNG